MIYPDSFVEVYSRTGGRLLLVCKMKDVAVLCRLMGGSRWDHVAGKVWL